MRVIRNHIPFIMLGITLVTSILSYFNIYLLLYDYLSDLVGYSVMTNIFMISVYFNGRYCFEIKMAVISLLLMNLLNMVLRTAMSYPEIYDFYITMASGVVFTVLILGNKCYYKFKR